MMQQELLYAQYLQNLGTPGELYGAQENKNVDCKLMDTWGPC